MKKICGSVGRASALCLGGCGSMWFRSPAVIPKTLKMALAALLLDTQHKDSRARNQPELVGPVFVCDREEYHTICLWHDISVKGHSTSER